MIKFSKISKLVPVKKLKNCIHHTGAPAALQKDVFESHNSIQHFNLMHNDFGDKLLIRVEVEQNPLDRAVIYKKVYDKENKFIKKIPYEVGIAKSKNSFFTTYHLVEDNTKREIGYINICNFTKLPKNKYTAFLFNKNLMKDYPEYGIVGERINIDYIQNNYESEFSGIAKITDQIAIEYCLRHNIRPLILSESEMNAHIAHYKRGRRFFLPKNEKRIKKFTDVFGTDNPNEILKDRLEKANGKRVECADLGDLLMYMPESVIQQYIEKIKQHPILH